VELKGKRALITGASSGIGEAIARRLAARGLDLCLVARRAARLDALAAELARAHSVKARVLARDLCAPDAAQRLFQDTEGQGEPIDVLVNNAGFGVQAPLLDAPWEKTSGMIHLNMEVLTELSYRFGRAMRERRQGWILNIASIGAYAPVPTMAVYGATKAYVRSFSEALALELRRDGVRVCTVSPGLTFTEFHAVAGQHIRPGTRMFGMSADRLARIALGALFAGRWSVVAGLSNQIATFLMKLVPRRLATAAAAMSISGGGRGEVS
jgi:short-subunit dehydrogenase